MFGDPLFEWMAFQLPFSDIFNSIRINSVGILNHCRIPACMHSMTFECISSISCLCQAWKHLPWPWCCLWRRARRSCRGARSQLRAMGFITMKKHHAGYFFPSTKQANLSYYTTTDTQCGWYIDVELVYFLWYEFRVPIEWTWVYVSGPGYMSGPGPKSK